MKKNPPNALPKGPRHQNGAVLLVSLVFLLLLTLLGISSMQNATLQEKMAGSLTLRNQTFQKAEAVLRLGESSIQKKGFTSTKCTSHATCAPPAESSTVTAAGPNNQSGVTWVAADGGFFAIQNLGTTTDPVKWPDCQSKAVVTLHRVTAVALQGTSRTVVESIYANC